MGFLRIMVPWEIHVLEKLTSLGTGMWSLSHVFIHMLHKLFNKIRIHVHSGRKALHGPGLHKKLNLSSSQVLHI